MSEMCSCHTVWSLCTTRLITKDRNNRGFSRLDEIRLAPRVLVLQFEAHAPWRATTTNMYRSFPQKNSPALLRRWSFVVHKAPPDGRVGSSYISHRRKCILLLVRGEKYCSLWPSLWPSLAKCKPVKRSSVRNVLRSGYCCLKFRHVEVGNQVTDWRIA